MDSLTRSWFIKHQPQPRTIAPSTNKQFNKRTSKDPVKSKSWEVDMARRACIDAGLARRRRAEDATDDNILNYIN